MTDAPKIIFIRRGDFQYYLLEDGVPLGSTEYIRADIARNEALEEAAKLADLRAEPIHVDNDWRRGYRRCAQNIAAAIRSLKT